MPTSYYAGVRWLSRLLWILEDGRHGDAPGSLFPYALRDLELYARGRELQRLAAGIDACRAQARGGARRAAAAARAQPDASHRFRTLGAAASRADDGGGRGGQIDSNALPADGQRADQSWRDVHGRTDALHELSRRVPHHASGLRGDAHRRGARAPRGTPPRRQARPRGDGATGSLQRPARGPSPIPRAVLRRLPDGPSLAGEEPGPHPRCRRGDVSLADQLGISGPPERALPRARIHNPDRLTQRA